MIFKPFYTQPYASVTNLGNRRVVVHANLINLQYNETQLARNTTVLNLIALKMINYVRKCE